LEDFIVTLPHDHANHAETNKQSHVNE